MSAVGIRMAALRRALAPAHASSTTTSAFAPYLPAAAASASLRPAAVASRPAHIRFTSSNGTTLGKHRFDQREAKRAEASNEKVVGRRNRDIPFRTVQVADQDGQLSDPTSLAVLLRMVDPRVDAVVLVSVNPVVVKVVNLELEQEQQREAEMRRKLTRRMAVEDKEVQVAWTSADGDLAHKIAVARGLLEKGDRVHVIFAMRAKTAGGARTHIRSERKVEIVGMFQKALIEVGKPWKEDSIDKGLWITYWEPLENIAAEAKRKVITDGSERRKARDEKKEARRLKEEERERKARERQAADKQ